MQIILASLLLHSLPDATNGVSQRDSENRRLESKVKFHPETLVVADRIVCSCIHTFCCLVAWLLGVFTPRSLIILTYIQLFLVLSGFILENEPELTAYFNRIKQVLGTVHQKKNPKRFL